LSENDLRKIIQLAIPLWKERFSELGIINILRLLTGRNAIIYNWFAWRTILGETFLGEDQLGYDFWVLGGLVSYYDEFYRLMDDGNLDRQLVLDLIALERALSERVEVVIVDFLDQFDISRDKWETVYSLGVEKIVDGDMEAATTAAWTPHSSATLTKETGSPSGFGVQVLKVDYNGITGQGAKQFVVTIGKKYRLTGYARSSGGSWRFVDGVGGASLRTGSGTTWAEVDVTYTAANDHLYLTVTSTGWAEFDNISLREVETPGITNPATITANKTFLMPSGTVEKGVMASTSYGQYAAITKFKLNSDSRAILWVYLQQVEPLLGYEILVKKNKVELYYGSGSSKSLKTSATPSFPIYENTWYKLRVVVNTELGPTNRFKIYIDGNKVIDYTWHQTPFNGEVAIGALINSVEFDNVEAYRLPSRQALIAPKNSIIGPELISDWDMEAVGVNLWFPTNNPIRTKELGSPSGIGTQVLRLTYNGTTNPGVVKGSLLTIGKLYRVSGYMRSSGVMVPRVYLGVKAWTGTTSSIWEAFNIDFRATGTDFLILCIGSGGYCEFDNISVKEINETGIETSTNFFA
jgi:hypothetical protein